MELLLARREPETDGPTDRPPAGRAAQGPGAITLHRTTAAASGATRPDIGPATRPDPGPEDFTDCYTRELSSLIWFVMSLGASAEVAADVAQSSFTDTFPVWRTIRHPRAWLRRVAERDYYRRGSRETLIESPPERPGPLPTASAAELRDKARTVLGALAALPPKQRQVMAWCIDGYNLAEIASELGADPAAVRQNLAKARKNLKRMLGMAGSTR